MKKEMQAYCGTYCETCDWKDKVDCKGCKAYGGEIFWGSCQVADCAISKSLDHCGQCEDMPCDKLREAFDNPEHGDNGERLENLKKWRDGKASMLKVTPIKAH